MTREQANEEAKKIFEDYCRKCDEIEKEAKEKGFWSTQGLDANVHLTHDLFLEVGKKLEHLKSLIDE